MPIVEITHRDFRTTEQKRQLARALNEAVREHFGAKKVYIVFNAVSDENFAEDGRLMADMPDLAGRPLARAVDENSLAAAQLPRASGESRR